MLIGNAPISKEINQSLILRLIKDREFISRAEISKVTGLNRSTVSNLTGELLEKNLIVETGRGESPVGRKPIFLTINPNGALSLGVQIGDSNLTVLIINISGKILFKERILITSNTDISYLVELAIDLSRKEIEKIQKKEMLKGIGIGIAGLVDAKKGSILFAPNLKGDHINVRELFQKELGIENIIVDNEVNAMVVGEMWFGAARGCQNILCVNVGQGVGSGIVVQNRLFRGVKGIAGEIGHTVIKPNGPACPCGNRGCLEVLCGGRALKNSILSHISKSDKSILSRLLKEKGMNIAVMLRKAADSGDPVAMKIIRDAGQYLGVGLGNAINILSPEIVVVGGRVVDYCSQIFTVASQKARKIALKPVKDIKIVKSELGEDSEAIGAATLILDRMFNPFYLPTPRLIR